MKIQDVIRTRRQALGLTQEALAERLGVSAPAVNKWEKALNYPDITLLPALARTLGVDLNTLLSFQEDLTEAEIKVFLSALVERAQQSGCGAAFALAQEKLREFSNNDLLAYRTAAVLEGLLALYPQGGEEEREGWKEKLTALYERAVSSADARVREEAVQTLASRCIREGDTARAELLLAEVRECHPGKALLTASLREAQGRGEEAWTVLERELFTRAQSAQIVLLQMIALAMKEGDGSRAQSLADASAAGGKALGLPEHMALGASFQLALLEKDGPKTLALLERLLESMSTPWKGGTSPLYCHLPVMEGADGGGRLLLQPMLEQVEKDPEAAFLREVPGYRALMEKYRSRT